MDWYQRAVNELPVVESETLSESPSYLATGLGPEKWEKHMESAD